MMTIWIKVSIQRYWMSATGHEGGPLHDAVAVRDADGLPYLPGRHLRGLLRHAVAVSQSEDAARKLFGGHASAGPHASASAGKLSVTDARLPDDIRKALRPTTKEKGALFRTLYSTQISEATGTASHGTLRTIEVVVPLDLIAEVSIVEPTVSEEESWAVLHAALPLIRAVGGNRNNGLGTARLSLWMEPGCTGRPWSPRR